MKAMNGSASQHALPRGAAAGRDLPERCLRTPRAHRRVEVPWRHRGAAVRQQGGVRQMRGTWPPHRRATELKRAAGAAQSHRQSVALIPANHKKATLRYASLAGIAHSQVL
jgi:hypothetical protein